MYRLGVVGISWQRGGPAALARFTVPAEARPELVAGLARRIGAAEVLYLATCNRVEVAFVTEGDVPVAAYRARVFAALTGEAPGPGEAERSFRAWAGEGAAEHLFLVAAGMDSARVGEREIAGQMRLALQLARDVGVLGPRLDLVGEEALKVAARVHRLTGVGEGKVSLAEIALEHVRGRVGGGVGRVALVGVSPMTTRCGQALAEEGVPLLVVNRGRERAEALGRSLGAPWMTLETFSADPPAVDALVSATGAPAAVLARGALEMLARRAPPGRPPLLIDMAVPPDIDPVDAAAAGLPRIDMETLLSEAEATRSQRLAELAEARLVVDDGLAALRRTLCDRLMAPMISHLRQKSFAQADAAVTRFLRRELPDLPAEKQRAFRRWTESLVQRMLHLPTVGLRSLAFEAGPEAVEVFLAEADAELARRLHEDTPAPPTPEAKVTLRLGTRGSDLARTQSGDVARQIEARGFDVQIHLVQTTGDRVTDRPFGAVGSAGIFVREIERALLDGEIDLAVHSYKDLPSAETPGLVVAAVPPPHDPRDCLLVRPDAFDPAAGLLPVRRGGRVGTASARRQALIRHHRPDLTVELLRGNVPTRVGRLADGAFDAIVLALAGIERLKAGGLDVLEGTELHAVPLDPLRFIPAPVQGALAVQVRADDAATQAAVAPLGDPAAMARIRCERALQRLIEGGCQLPFGAFAWPADGALHLRACVEVDGVLRFVEARGADPLQVAADAYHTLALSPPGSPS